MKIRAPELLRLPNALLALALLTMGMSAHATDVTVTPPANWLTPADTSATNDAPDRSYELSQDTAVHVVNVMNDDHPELVGQTVVLPKESEITVLGSMMDPVAGQLVRIGVDADEDDGLPTDFWVPADELLQGGLVDSEISTLKDDPVLESDDDAAPAFSEEARHVHLARHKRHKRHMTYCYRYVKEYLLHSGKVPIYLPGGSAWMAASMLPHYGFRRTGHNGHSARLGEVCVYRGGNGGNGHIEVKRAGGWWYGYGYHRGPITDRLARNHRLVACFSK